MQVLRQLESSRLHRSDHGPKENLLLKRKLTVEIIFHLTDFTFEPSKYV